MPLDLTKNRASVPDGPRPEWPRYTTPALACSIDGSLRSVAKICTGIFPIRSPRYSANTIAIE